MLEDVRKAVEAIRKVTDFEPKVALTLGSGLGNFADHIEVKAEISYRDIPGFPVSTAPGHDGKFIFGYVGGPDPAAQPGQAGPGAMEDAAQGGPYGAGASKTAAQRKKVPVVCMKGRVHLYEGYPIEKVVLPARTMHALGADILFLTNACGGLKPTYHPGTLALVTDHISDFVPNPLIGPNDDEEGVRFPDMTHVYDPGLQEIIRKAARDHDIPLDDGVYVQLTGPSFETPAEIRMIRAIGGDMAGMSTVVEAIVGRHMGMRVCCVSLISNLAAGISPKPLSSEEVNEAGEAAEPMFTELVTASIEAMG